MGDSAFVSLSKIQHMLVTMRMPKGYKLEDYLLYKDQSQSAPEKIGFVSQDRTNNQPQIKYNAVRIILFSSLDCQSMISRHEIKRQSKRRQ
jgi:hypothetical protein